MGSFIDFAALGMNRCNRFLYWDKSPLSSGFVLGSLACYAWPIAATSDHHNHHEVILLCPFCIPQINETY